MKKWEWWLLTGFGAGNFPKAPGTAGSVVGILIGSGVIFLFPSPNWTLILLTLLFGIVGIKLTDKYEEEGGIHDDKRIVIDEIAGVLLATALFKWNGSWIEEIGKLILIFLTFRLFDIWKPSLIGKVDQKLPGGLGVVGDDLLAGIFGAILAGLIWVGIGEGLALIG